MTCKLRTTGLGLEEQSHTELRHPLKVIYGVLGKSHGDWSPALLDAGSLAWSLRACRSHCVRLNLAEYFGENEVPLLQSSESSN